MGLGDALMNRDTDWQEVTKHLESANAELLEALQALVAHQNGCPLPKYENGWNRAMALATAAIAKAEGK
jgi:hypothetical protein